MCRSNNCLMLIRFNYVITFSQLERLMIKLAFFIFISFVTFIQPAIARTVSIMSSPMVMMRGTTSPIRSGVRLDSKNGAFGFGAVYYAATPRNPNSYVMTARFDVNKKTDSIGIILPIGDGWAQLVLGGWAGRFSGINNVNGILVNKAGNPSHARAGFRFGEKVTVRLKVHHGTVSLRVNGTKISQFDYRNNKIRLISNVQQAVQKLKSKTGKKGGIGFYVQSGYVDISSWKISDL